MNSIIYEVKKNVAKRKDGFNPVTSEKGYSTVTFEFDDDWKQCDIVTANFFVSADDIVKSEAQLLEDMTASFEVPARLRNTTGKIFCGVVGTYTDENDNIITIGTQIVTLNALWGLRVAEDAPMTLYEQVLALINKIKNNTNADEVEKSLAAKADKINTFTKDESINNFGLFENVKAHGVVANDISKAKDNANNIQSLIDYCKNNGISTIYFPEGHYYIDRPIYLYEYMEIKGQSQYSTHIIKTTNVTDRNGVDSIIVFENYKEDKKSSTTNGQKVKCIDIVGCTENYLLVVNETGDFVTKNDASKNYDPANIRIKLDTNYTVTNTVIDEETGEEKTENVPMTSGERQVAIYAHVNSPYVVVEEVETHNVDHAIDLKGAWIGRFSKLKIRGHYIGFRVRSQSQGIVLSGINVIGTHEYGFYLTGSNYNSLESIFTEWAYGGVAFHFGWGNYSINGIGYEISKDLTDGIYADRANVNITNAMLPQQNLDEFNAIHAVTNSVVDISSSAYGFQSQQYTELRTGRLYKIESKSKLLLRSSVRCGLTNSAEFPTESVCDSTSEVIRESMNTAAIANEYVSGHFTIPTELADYISANSGFYCQKIGRAVIMTVNIVALSDFPDTITDTTEVVLEGIPYKCLGVSSRQVIFTSQKNIKNVIIKANSSSFTLYGGLKKGEAITSTVTYITNNT